MSLPKNPYKLYLFEEVNYKTAENIIRGIDQANNNDSTDSILLKICSHGGKLATGFAIWDAILNSPKPVFTLATGRCASAAAMLLQAGKKRFATQNAIIFLHHSSISIKQLSYYSFDEYSENYKLNHKLFMKLSSQKTGLTIEEFEEIILKTQYLRPKEALKFGKHGLLDEII